MSIDKPPPEIADVLHRCASSPIREPADRFANDIFERLPAMSCWERQLAVGRRHLANETPTGFPMKSAGSQGKAAGEETVKQTFQTNGYVCA